MNATRVQSLTALPQVMLIEDDPAIREEIAEFLSDCGYEVAVAENGADALTQLRAGGQPRLILLDLMMPVMDGWTFRSEQLKEPRLAHIPVVLISGSQDVASEAARLGAASYLTKPFTIEALLAEVQRLGDTPDA